MLTKGVIGHIDPLVWVTERSVLGADHSAVTKLTSVQLNFVCDVVGETFQVDPDEHSVGVWAAKEEAERLDISTRMRSVVEDAFEWKDGGESVGLKL